MSDEAKELQALLDAWHGSHADFHKFRDDKINSGEGAQVYGVGHYLGGLRGVSRHYTVQNTAKRNQGLISNLSFNGRDAKELHNWAGDLFAHLDHGVQLAKLDPTSSPHLADQLRREHAEEDKRLRDWGHDLGVSAELHDRMTKLHAQVLSQTLSELLYPEMRGSKGTPHYTLRSAASYYGQQYAQEALGRSQFHNGLNDTDDELKDHAENLARSVYTDLEPLVNQLKTAEPPHPGRLYKVQVKAHPDQMLDWDEPIKNHPKDVLEKLDNGRIIPGDLKDLDDDDTGQDLYRQATHFYEQLLDDAVYSDDSYTFPKDLLQAFKDAGGDDRARRRVAGLAASKALLDAGVQGIKYRDGFSRHKNGNYSYNYVIFDPKLIKIVRKYDKDGNLVQDNSVHLKTVDHDPFTND